jgi:hypothetical protein
MVFLIVAIFGSILTFVQSIQQLLNVQLTAFQLVQVSLLVIGILGLAITLRNALQKPQTSQLLPFYRSDKFDAQTDKDRYELEQEIFFTATFTGKLRAGYFESVLVAPDNKVHRVSDPQTLQFSKHRQRGLLQGEIPDACSRWSTRVPIDCPLGEFTAHIGVYDSPPLDWFTETGLRGLLYWAVRRFLHKRLGMLAPPPRPCVDQKTVRFSIVKRLEDGQA